MVPAKSRAVGLAELDRDVRKDGCVHALLLRAVYRATGLFGEDAAGTDGHLELADGRLLEVANVIWCTGFSTDFGWIDLPVFAENGRPIQYRGVVASTPGLYFIGLEFLYAATSAVLPGVGRDAGYIAKHIAKRVRPGVTAPSGAEAIPIASHS